MKNHIRQLLPLYMIVFISFLGYATTVALFMPMIMQKSSAFVPTITSISDRARLIGLLITTYPLGQFLGAPVLGSLADRFGRKKVLTLSLLLAATGYLFISISLTLHALGMLFISLFFTGLCEANMAIAQAAATDLTTTDNRGKLIGYLYVMCSLGYIVGPLIGGFLAHYFSYALPFWLTLALLLVTFLWIQIAFKDQHVPSMSKESILMAFINLRTVFSNAILRNNYLINFLIFFACFGFYRCYLIYMIEKWHVNELLVAIIFSIISFICMLANMFVNGPLLKKLGYFYASILTIGLGGILFMLATLPTTLYGFVIMVGLAAFVSVLSFSACTALLSSLADDAIQGAVLGNNQALQVLGEALSATIGGFLASLSIHLSLMVMGALAVFAAYCVLQFTKKRVLQTQ